MLFEHVLRELNTEADALATEAITKRRSEFRNRVSLDQLNCLIQPWSCSKWLVLCIVPSVPVLAGGSISYNHQSSKRTWPERSEIRRT